jgi:Uma2 family endonuclease
MAIELRLSESAVTEGSLLELSRKNPGYRFERSAEGTLIVAPSGLFASGGEGELTYQVMTYAKTTGLGRAFPSTGGFTLPDTSIVAPDTTYVTHARLASVSREALSRAYIPLVPNVVFELVSPSDSLSEAVRKMELYLTNGVDVAVLIGPDSVEVRRSGEKPDVSFEDAVTIGPEMPGFTLDVRSIRKAAIPPTA